MAKKQTRRAISVRGTTYDALRLDCFSRGVSMSDYIEELVAADRKARGLGSTTVASAVAAVQRAGDRQVERTARAVQAAIAAPAPRSAATTAELRELVTEEANRLIPRLPTGWSAEDLEVAGRAAAAEAERIFDPTSGGRLVDTARPLVRRAMTARLRDVREEATATAATTTTATAKPAAAKPAPVAATAAAATSAERAVASTTTAAEQRPTFRRHNGGISDSERIWNFLEAAVAPKSTREIAVALNANYFTVSGNIRRLLDEGFVEGNGKGWSSRRSIPARPAAPGAAAAPMPRESSIKAGPPPEQTAMLGRAETPPSKVPTCPCCGRQSLRAGVRCGTCSIACVRTGDSWKRGKMCPAGNRVVDVDEPVDEPEDEGEEEGDSTPLRRSMPAVDPVRGGRPPSPISNRSSREPTFDDLEESEEKERRPPRLAPALLSPIRRPPPPIPEGSAAGSAQGAGRPPGLRVEPVRQRSPEETKKIAKVDPIAAVHAGRSGVQF